MLAQHRVRLPITEPLPAIDDSRPFINRAGFLDGRTQAARPLAVALVALAQMAVQLATPGFVGGHMAVYPLVTHHEAYLLAHRAYLLRAPPPGECQLDKLDDIGR